MKVDPRFLKEEGYEVFLGNELLVKGLLETEGGTHLWTGYPGSPVAGFFDCIESIQEIPRQYGIQATMANNEALSVAMLNGSQMSGMRAIAVMKSVGLHVAADALALGNLGGAHPEGGVVVVSGDDPWSSSTQVPADSRYLFKHLYMPILEPSTNQEIKDWIDLGFKLSRESELYIGYLITTHQADGGGSVQARRNHFPRVNTHNKFSIDTTKVDFENKVLLPPRTWRKEQDFERRYQLLWQSAEKYGINRTVLPTKPLSAGKKYPVGFVTSALAASYLEHALGELGLNGEVPVLKLGVTFPLNPKWISDFAAQVEMLVVVEERRGFLEEQIAVILAKLHNHTPLYGKQFPFGLKGFPDTLGMNPSIVLSLITPLLQKLAGPTLPVDAKRLQSELDLIAQTASYEINLAPRTPTFCPGCPHRDSASVLIEVKKSFMDPAYMQRKHRREPVDLVFHGDTGCYTMLMFEPTKDLMHNYSGMGLGGGTGLGIDPFITNKQVVFMGDSTFFHSGQIAISNSVKNGQDITYIILDNKTTAMTGHQPTPGLELDIMGNPTFVQSLDKIIEAMVEQQQVDVIRTNPEQRDQYRSLLEETILRNGVKVIVADKECGITFHRRRNRAERAEAKKNGFVRTKSYININTDVCENCLECTRATGCPGLTFVDTNFGRKVQTDLSWCVTDTACTKIHACPSFEEITVVRSQKPLSRLEDLQQTEWPEPKPRRFDDRWHIYMAGVGGMGIAVSAATLVRAGHREGYDVIMCDKNGLAIRNGGVYSQITFLERGEAERVSPLIPYGKADLILGIDILEAARGLDPAGNQRVGSPARTAAIINKAKTPTILTLLGKDDFCVDSIEADIRKYTNPKHYFSADISEVSERVFGSKIYANIIMLGVAYQLGQLPFSLSSLEYGIQETMGSASAENWQAFKLGRKIVLDANKTAAKPDTYHSVVAEKSDILRRTGRHGEQLARDYWGIVSHAMNELRLDDLEQQRLLAERIYELIQYDGHVLARDYVDRLIRLHRKDSAEFGYAATQAALWNLHRVMAIKDEIYVAHLLTSEEKYARDRERYNIDPELGDKVVYRHLNRPEFILGAWKLRFHIKSQPWMLRLMRRGKILRKLLPLWHREEKQFRDWYLHIAEQFSIDDPADYPQWLTLLRLPEEARGYREVRYPKMRDCRQRGDAILTAITGAASTSLHVANR